jgi:DNA excision repair protein ERCC-4
MEVSRCLLGSHPPNVIELAQPMTAAMKDIQSYILVAMKGCIGEIKKCVPQLDASLPHLELTLENALFRSFDVVIRNQLDLEWHKIGPKPKQLVQDLGQLRKLLDYLLRYDGYSFYAFLVSLQNASAMQSYPSLW